MRSRSGRIPAGRRLRQTICSPGGRTKAAGDAIGGRRERERERASRAEQMGGRCWLAFLAFSCGRADARPHHSTSVRVNDLLVRRSSDCADRRRRRRRQRRRRRRISVRINSASPKRRRAAPLFVFPEASAHLCACACERLRERTGKRDKERASGAAFHSAKLLLLLICVSLPASERASRRARRTTPIGFVTHHRFKTERSAHVEIGFFSRSLAGERLRAATRTRFVGEETL